MPTREPCLIQSVHSGEQLNAISVFDFSGGAFWWRADGIISV